jgi:hypothetical protein
MKNNWLICGQKMNFGIPFGKQSNPSDWLNGHKIWIKKDESNAKGFVSYQTRKKAAAQRRHTGQQWQELGARAQRLERRVWVRPQQSGGDEHQCAVGHALQMRMSAIGGGMGGRTAHLIAQEEGPQALV